MGFTVDVTKHKAKFGAKEAVHSVVSRGIKRILTEKASGIFETGRAEVYNFLGKEHTFFDVGHKERIMIFVNSAYAHDSIETVKQDAGTMFGVEHSYDTFIVPSGDVHLILSDSGVPIAEYSKDLFTLNILFDLFPSDLTGDANIARAINIFQGIIYHIAEHFWNAIKYEHSWKHTQDKDALSSKVQERAKRLASDELNRAKENVREAEQRIEHFQKELRNNHTRLIQNMKKVEMGEGLAVEAGKKVVHELDLIANHPKVEDVVVKESKIFVETTDIYMYDKHDRRYYAGKYKIELKPETSQIKFEGSNPRRSYWTAHDPHPHVNGNSRNPCLGSLASTVAELSAQNELYALTLSAIDFLEAVNIDDSAGKYVKYWDMVDEEGNIIREGGEDNDIDADEDGTEYETCYEDGHDYDVEDMVDAYEAVSETGEVHGHRRVYEDNLEDNYTFIRSVNANTVGSWIHDNGIPNREENEVIEQ